jgi:uncharacterized secreted protein with C-terminal beta-propeller domain
MTGRRRFHTPTRAVVTVVVGLSLVGGQAATARPKTTQQAVNGFRRFSSCDAFLKYIRPIALDQVGPYGFNQYGGRRPVEDGAPTTAAAAPRKAQPAPAPAAPVADAADSATGAGTSQTNTQEAGVDEGDLVETDGRYVYAGIGRKVYVTDALAGKQVASIDLPNNTYGTDLILDGKRLAVVTSASSNVGPESVVVVVDVTNPAAPVKLSTTHLEGQALAIRSVDHRARLVLSTSFGQRVQQQFPQPPQPVNSERELKKRTEANRNVIRRAPVTDWLPRTYRELADGSQTPIVQALTCGEIGRPRDNSGLGLTWVATIDLDVPNARPGAIGSAGVVAEGGIVYASSDTLYVATQQWQRRPSGVPSSINETEIQAFDMRPADGAAWLAGGSFIGTLINSYSMSEFDGSLRVATTRSDAGFGGDTNSGVQIVRLDANDRRKLITVGQLWGLGTNERIYAVRFLQNQAYIVTFRQTDPLYVLDLTDIRAPRKVGELKIPGFSSYLHPIGDGLLIGVGKSATDQGRVTGSQASLFDVSDPTAPKLLSTLDIGSSSGAEFDPHAFLWWAETRDLVLPTVKYPTYDGKTQVGPSSGAIVARVGAKAAPTFAKRGQITHDGKIPGAPPATPTTPAPPVTTIPDAKVAPQRIAFDPIIRTLIVSGKLVSVSNEGLMTSDLATLSESSWVKFA